MNAHSTPRVATQVCGLFHSRAGSFCMRTPGHAGQHILLSEGQHMLWTKDLLSCKCKHAGLCPRQACLISIPIGEKVAQAAIADGSWTWDPVE